MSNGAAELPPEDRRMELSRRRYTGSILILLAPDQAEATLEYDTDVNLAEIRDTEALAELSDFLAEEGLEARRLVRSVAPGEIRAVEAKFDEPPPRSLTAWWKITGEVSADFPGAHQGVMARLSELEAVLFTDLEERTSLPQVDPGNEDRFVDQSYLAPAPDGIGVQAAWSVGLSGKGGTAFLDLEWGWYLGHREFQGVSATRVFGDDFSAQLGQSEESTEVAHGTAVLGLVVGQVNQEGIVGAAPGVETVRLASLFDGAGGAHSVVDAVAKAADTLNPGDVLLLERELADGRPIETVLANLDAIIHATSRGIVVVECAGNGDVDLDAELFALDPDPNNGFIWGQRLNVNGPHFEDSGAIMVGAGEPGVVSGGHCRWEDSNYGSRIDCYAWGDSVTTAGSDSAPLDDSAYRSDFGGTSAAGAIIAGAALLVQELGRTLGSGPYTPEEMRKILSNPATGTPQAPSASEVSEPIGVMPDLALILPELADLYVKDRVRDEGVRPSKTRWFLSPDILLSGDQTPPSPLPPTPPIPPLPLPTGPLFIHTRAWNAKALEGPETTVRLYHAPLTTLSTPDTWQFIGDTHVSEIPAPQPGGGARAASFPPLGWPQPPGGPVGLIAVLGNRFDPFPIDDPAAWDRREWDGFLALLADHNNLAIRNVDTITLDDTGRGRSERFSIRGAPTRRRTFDLRLESFLPPGAQVWIVAPGLRGLVLSAQASWYVSATGPDAQLIGGPWNTISIRDVALPAGSDVDARIVVVGASSDTHGTVRLRQQYLGQDVGGITWWIRAPST